MFLYFHQELNKEISEHSSDLTGVLNSGAELRKHATTDDAATLDTDLAEISRRYNALRDLSRTRFEQMTEVPAILERFYDAHSTMLEWMQQMETEMSQGEIKPGLEAELRLQVCLCCVITTTGRF